MRTIGIVLSMSAIFLVALFFVVQKEQKEIEGLQTKVVELKKEKTYLEKEIQRSEHTSQINKEAYDSLVRQKEVLEEQQLNTETSEQRKKFADITKKLFQKMYTFTPETYGSRKKEVKEWLSEELYQQYFSEKTTVGDSNGISSDLLSCEVYVKAWTTKTIDGLVVVKYSSGSAYGSQKGMNLFSISFNPESQRITRMDNLGSGYTSDLLE
ncbi:hypothetical protein IGK80_001130 [Enterococcus sp. DIV0609]|uniref:hypothetical protein n=1 Tax=unclassified Enterococcus TaxID=2608891 RepID=UPI003F1FE0E3